jgi:hypothetical protein
MGPLSNSSSPGITLESCATEKMEINEKAIPSNKTIAERFIQVEIGKA